MILPGLSRRTDRAASLLTLAALVAFCGCIRAQGTDNSVLIDVEKGLRKQLTMVYSNNIELVKRTLYILDRIPTTEKVRKAGAEFIKLHFPANKRISIKNYIGLTRSLKSNSSRNSLYRAVAYVFLDQASTMRQTNLPVACSNLVRPHTILNCCPSPCKPCKAYPPHEPVGTGNETKPMFFNPTYNETELIAKKKWKSWFFPDDRMSIYISEILRPYNARGKALQRSLANLLEQLPSMGPNLRKVTYFRRMLELLASVGVRVDRSTFNMEVKALRTEPGFVPLMAAWARMLRYACPPPRFCQLAECNFKETPEFNCNNCQVNEEDMKRERKCATKMPRPSALDRREPILNLTSADLHAEGHPDALPQEIMEEAFRDHADERGRNRPGFNPNTDGLVDAEKLRIDYRATAGLDNSDLTTVDRIERATIKCGNGYLCKFQNTCGGAPMNAKRREYDPYVVNGVAQVYGEWPSFVRLEITKPDYTGSTCGGTLISDRHILTAAHCVVDGSLRINHPDGVSAYLGDNFLDYQDSHEVTQRASKICVAKKYMLDRSAQTKDDWALITLAKPVRFNEHIQPACLPFKPITRRGKQSRCFVVGSGIIGFTPGPNGQAIFPESVQKLRVDQVSCRAWKLSDLDRSRECYSKADRQKGDSCAGDSGGPVLCQDNQGRWTVVATVSYGTAKCNDRGYEAWVGVYTRLRTLVTEMQKQCGV